MQKVIIQSLIQPNICSYILNEATNGNDYVLVGNKYELLSWLAFNGYEDYELQPASQFDLIYHGIYSYKGYKIKSADSLTFTINYTLLERNEDCWFTFRDNLFEDTCSNGFYQSTKDFDEAMAFII